MYDVPCTRTLYYVCTHVHRTMHSVYIIVRYSMVHRTLYKYLVHRTLYDVELLCTCRAKPQRYGGSLGRNLYIVPCTSYIVLAVKPCIPQREKEKEEISSLFSTTLTGDVSHKNSTLTGVVSHKNVGALTYYVHRTRYDVHRYYVLCTSYEYIVQHSVRDKGAYYRYRSTIRALRGTIARL